LHPYAVEERAGADGVGAGEARRARLARGPVLVRCGFELLCLAQSDFLSDLCLDFVDECAEATASRGQISSLGGGDNGFCQL
jgi:hypothetical protein